MANESDVYVRRNTALIEQADITRRGKLQELSATLDCLRACRDNPFTYSWETDRIRKAAMNLLNELFPDSATPVTTEKT